MNSSAMAFHVQKQEIYIDMMNNFLLPFDKWKTDK